MPEAVVEPGCLAGREVLFLNWKSPSHPEAGGAEVYCWALATRLARAGIRVTLLTARHRGAPAAERVEGIQIERRGGTFSIYPLAGLYLLRNRGRFAAVVDCQNGIPFLAPLWLRGTRTAIVTLIHHVHQAQFRERFGRVLAWLGRRVERDVARWVYGERPVVVVSPSTRAAVRLRLGLRGPIYIVPNGTAVSEHPPRRPSRQPLIVFVGRLVPHKRVNLLLEAIPEVRRLWPSLRVAIVGDGPARPALTRLAARLGVDDAVSWHGRVSDSERDRLLASGWLTVLPSQWEGWGLTVMEANAAGLPAVGFRAPGVVDAIVDGCTGWLVDTPGELPAVLDRALHTLSNPAEERRISTACREWARAFRWQASAQRLADLLSSELQSSGTSERRRTASDCVVVATLQTDATLEEVRSRLRSSDFCRTRADKIELVLNGSDTQQAMTALSRLEIAGEALLRVARSRDLLGLNLDAGALELATRVGLS